MKNFKLLNNKFRYKENENYIYDKDLEVKIEKETFNTLENRFNEQLNYLFNYYVDKHKEYIGNTEGYDSLQEVQDQLQKDFVDLEIQKAYLNFYEEDGSPIINRKELMYKVVETIYLIEARYHAISSFIDWKRYVVEQEMNIYKNN